MAGIEGIGPDAPIEVNEKGGKGSKMPYAFAWLDALAMFALAKVVMYGGQKYGFNNWRKVDTLTHLNHALTHIYAWLAGDRQDDHLEHAFCRLMMAVATARDENTPKMVTVEAKRLDPNYGKCNLCLYGWDHTRDDYPCNECYDDPGRPRWEPKS